MLVMVDDVAVSGGGGDDENREKRGECERKFGKCTQVCRFQGWQ